MAYKYKHFIPQNIAPSGVKHIGVYDSNGKRVCTIPLGGLTPPMETKIYSFGLVSDMHLNITDGYVNSTKFDNALTYFEEQGAAFCCHAGDITNIGFWYPEKDAINSGIDYIVIYPHQFGEYKRVCDLHPNLPVYGCCGNHESYTKSITENLLELEEYIGHGLNFMIPYGKDLFIFLGQPLGGSVMTDEALQWLYEILEENRNKRCFVFVHAYIEEDSGDAMDVRENSIFEMWGSEKKKAFMNLISHYKNAILLHGHSHMKLHCQELDKSANYTEKNGFRSIHIPSSSSPRDVDVVNLESVNDYTASEGYIVDVYDNYIVLNGIDFINEKAIPLGVYKIDTTLQIIEANTFEDSTGIIII